MIKKHAILMFPESPDDHQITGSANESDDTEEHDKVTVYDQPDDDRNDPEKKSRCKSPENIYFTVQCLSTVAIRSQHLYIQSEIDTAPLLLTREVPEETVNKLMDED